MAARLEVELHLSDIFRLYDSTYFDIFRRRHGITVLQCSAMFCIEGSPNFDPSSAEWKVACGPAATAKTAKDSQGITERGTRIYWILADSHQILIKIDQTCTLLSHCCIWPTLTHHSELVFSPSPSFFGASSAP